MKEKQTNGSFNADKQKDKRKMSTEKTNGVRTRQYNKKQEKNPGFWWATG